MSLRFRPFRTFFGQLPVRWFSTTTRSLCESRSTPNDKPLFPGSRSSWTEKLEFLGSETYEGIPVYRVTDRDGKIIDPSQDPQLGQEKITKMYKGTFSLLLSVHIYIMYIYIIYIFIHTYIYIHKLSLS